MIFLILTGIVGLLLVVFPVFAALWLRKNWKIEKWLFFRAGVALLAIEIFSAMVVSNGISIWPQFADLPLALKAVIYGLIAGLFFELGRFLILDRLMPKVRSFREAVAFGIGWSGVEIFIIGISLFFGTFAMHLLATSTDLLQTFPNVSQDQMQQISEFRDQTLQLLNGSPLLALTPLLERFSLMLIDIALTLLIIFGLIRGDTRYPWIAVGTRALLMALLFGLGSVYPLMNEMVFAIFGILAFVAIHRIQQNFPNHLRV